MVKLAIVTAMLMHPLHTTMTELLVDAPNHHVRATVRVFADDFERASRKAPSPDAYVASALRLTDAGGKTVSLRACGTRRTGDLLWVCVEGTFAGEPTGLRIANALLCELFDDQVNIIQVSRDGERRSILFVRGDGAKRVE